MSPLIYITWILAFGVLAQWLAWKIKIPSILLLLAFGFAFGQVTGVRVDDFLAPGDGHGSPLLSIVGLLVAIILFEGGLTLRFRELRESGLPILRLCTLAVAFSFGLTTWFMHRMLGYDIRLAALVGAILTVTGPTVVAPLLQHVRLRRKMSSIVKWEGIVVDPIGAVLAVLVFKLALASDPMSARADMLKSLGLMFATGVVGGIALAKLIEHALKRHLVPDFLQPVFLLGSVAVAFTVSNSIEKETGLVTVTVLGIALANQKSVSVRHILEFKENLRILIISTLFLVLSARIAPEHLGATMWKGLFLLVFLVLVGRPVSVLASLVFSKKTTRKERLMLAFLAPRGIVAAAVTSIFALEFQDAAAHGGFGPELSPLLAAQSRDLEPLVFLVIVGTVAIYGLGAVPLAKRLGLSNVGAGGVLFGGADAWVRLVAKALHDDGQRVMLLDTNYGNISAARMQGIEAQRANIISEFAEEELDLGGFNQLVAGTANDEVNSIAAYRFIHQFGRAGVWQITPADNKEHHKKAAHGDIRARLCFEGGPTHAELAQMVAQGATVKNVLITAVFTFADFQRANPGARVLFIRDDRAGTRPAAVELGKVAEGTTLYALVPESSPAG